MTTQMRAFLMIACVMCLSATQVNAEQQEPKSQPNIIIVFADDISAREFPIYGSSVWTKEKGVDTSDRAFRAETPVLNQMAQEGCWIKTAWASVVCSPSRAMMMTGRYAHLHKWWQNSYKGRYIDENGKETTWPLYMSSPLQIGHVAQQAGYGTYWAGKTQMAGDLREYGFDQGCFTPGNLSDKDNPYTDFKLVQRVANGERLIFNADTGKPIDTYLQHGWYFYPHVRLMNYDDQDFQWWPNTDESREAFGPGTYGPDVELDFIFDFMDRQHSKGRPFFVYHTTHLGHGAFDWLNPANGQCWPGTPVVQWDGNKYTRIEPHITGDDGVYDNHGTVTETGIQSHIEYLDYQMWLYRNRLREMGIADNTVIIFCADNGTSGYGKGSHDRQKGVHVPLIIFAPGMTKHGQQDVLVNMSDLLPTIADLTGATIPKDYVHNGESLVPFLFTDKSKHRQWIYGYSRERQIIRGDFVMRDGYGKWWDVAEEPADLISYDQITNWDDVSQQHRDERDKLKIVLPKFDLFDIEPDAPGVRRSGTIGNPTASSSGKKSATNKTLGTKKASAGASTVGSQQWKPVFEDDFDNRTKIGKDYTTARGHEDSWSVINGVLVGKQTKADHGAVIRTQLDFDDIDIQFDFRFSGGKSFNFVIDDQNEKSVHAGHICRASVFPKFLKIGDDKTGGMNLEVRKQRQDKNLSARESEALKRLLERTGASAKISIHPGQWHTLRIRIRGDIMKAFLDDELVTSLRSPGFDHPTKTKFGFTVNGQSIDFDNLVVKRLVTMDGRE
ncbi:sulfatase-like hydrolase/transferase [Crateriforma conspicua]|uniref:Sulfatase n=1 Tax=Crateriforma conspicua TaxID=2527996 RepID=A0A5C6FPL2_9PLAN|nr:sulfatase-like hydrolase/transferase [Crateriforma conspicua]TWU62031.1 Sulfatase [Crateriforma conspicua]